MGKGISATLKSVDTEELADIYFYRPVGYLWALLFRRLGVHPNVVTILSIVLGVAAAVLFYFVDLRLNVIGMLLLVWANMYDSADGQLARLTGQKTELGRILDGFAGDVWFFSIYVAICLRLQPVWGIWIWILAAWAGCVCHAKQCQLADYYRNIHLFFLKGKQGSELHYSDVLQAEFQTIGGKGSWLRKVFGFFYIRYTRSQERMSPAFQSLMNVLRCREADSSISSEVRDTFLLGSRPLMKYTNILTFNVRSWVLFASLFAGVPWVYFLFEMTVLQGLFYYMRYRHETLCRDIINNIERDEEIRGKRNPV